MRLNAFLDAVSVLSSLGGDLLGPRVCLSHLILPSAAYEAARLPTTASPASIIAFIDVNVVPMDRERVLTNQTVLVSDERITALGPTNQVKVPAGAVRIDGRGRYLMPGLSNMHVHRLRVPQGKDNVDNLRAIFRNYLEQGITTIRTLEGPDIGEMRQLRAILENAEFPRPRLYLAREIPRSMLTQPDSVAAYVAESKAAGYSHIGTSYILHARSPEQRAVLDSLVAAARRAGLPISAHSHALPFGAVLALGTAGGSTDHLYAFWDSLLGKPGPTTTMFLATTNKPMDLPMSKVPTLIAAVKDAGVWMTPTLSCMEKVHSYIKMGLPQLVKAMHDAGVRLLLGEDGMEVHNELAALVRAGLTPYQALLTGTRNVAQYFGMLDSNGTVAVEKSADLILLAGNPLTDIQHAQKPVGVMAAGRWIDLE